MSHRAETRAHRYLLDLTWTGDRGGGTTDPRSYARDYEVQVGDRPALRCSADAAFRGDGSRYNPEELLLAAVSSCHLLSYLYACATNGVVVVGYTDQPVGTMVERPDGSGAFTEVLLRPQVTVADAGTVDVALRLHDEAHRTCFICGSLNFPVRHEATIHTHQPAV